MCRAYKFEGEILYFFDRISALCKERGTSPSAVAREIGLNNSSATYWKRGSIPKGDTLQKLAIYFGVTTDYLLGNVSDPFFYLDNERIIREINSYSDDDLIPEKRITVALSKLNENGRCIAADRVEELTEIPRYRREEAPEPGPPTPDTPLPADAPEGPETGK